jgi:hypothetical protein
MLFPVHLIFTLLLGLALRVGDGFPLYPNENYYDQQIDEVPEPIPQEQSILSSVYERVKAPLSRASGAIANAFPSIIGYPIRKPAPKHRLTQSKSHNNLIGNFDTHSIRQTIIQKRRTRRR